MKYFLLWVIFTAGFVTLFVAKPTLLASVVGIVSSEMAQTIPTEAPLKP